MNKVINNYPIIQVPKNAQSIFLSYIYISQICCPSKSKTVKTIKMLTRIPYRGTIIYSLFYSNNIITHDMQLFLIIFYNLY